MEKKIEELTFEERIKLLSTPTDVGDIDFRTQSINKGGYMTTLAYKDARYDMRKLDECVGALNWQKRFNLIDGQLFCDIGIYNPETGQWVWKGDVGTESKTEAEKGRASDAFKRAGFNWGIGRDLYDFPNISIKLLNNEWEEKNGKGYATFSLKMKDWKWFIKRDKKNNVHLMAFQKLSTQDKWMIRFDSKKPSSMHTKISKDQLIELTK